ncbi:MAG TPA: Tol-Pal system beta propeller repeat protein TolB [Terriglobia bacterium]|nr:Tol-Pal system beta propeller repeat protein TolB [Terriglobia bacterium]
MKSIKRRLILPFVLLAITAALILPRAARAQNSWIETGINRGNPLIRIAVANFPAASNEANLSNLTNAFNQVLSNDLGNAGIFQMVSKSMYPAKTPSNPGEVVFDQWTNPPAATQFLVFGNTADINGNLVVTAYLYDVKNPANPSVLAKRYIATLNEVSTRETAHRFANEIIKTLGGGIPGINLSQIAFVSSRTGHEEIWVMDYDGFNQHPITSYGQLCLTPRWSPDDTKLAFTNYASGNPEISIYSFLTHHLLPFPHYRGLNTTPAWSPDGKKLAFCSSMSGTPEVYVSGETGSGLQRLTFSPSVNISPVWNPKTGNEIAFVSDRSGTPQIYIMNADGTNLRRLITAGGDAVAPSWSPNGLFITFAWAVTETGTYDVYVIEIATGRIIQLTHDAGRNEHPWWAPDGRHLIFESTRTGKKEVWMMLADGSDQKQITTQGENWNPSWSN